MVMNVMHGLAKSNLNFKQERIDLAASFRWAERFNFHEGVADHFHWLLITAVQNS